MLGKITAGMHRTVLVILTVTLSLFPGADETSVPAVAESTAPPVSITTASTTSSNADLSDKSHASNETTGIPNITPNASTIQDTIYLMDAVANATPINAPTERGATYVIAASDAPAHVKAQADAVATGTADQVLINIYTNTPNREIRLQAGTYILSGNITLASNVTLNMEPGTLINGLGDGSRVYRLITNADWVGGNTDIEVYGGVVDARFTNGARVNEGGVLYFAKVKGLKVVGTTIRNGYNHNIEVCRSQYVILNSLKLYDARGDDNLSITDGQGPAGSNVSESRNIRVEYCYSEFSRGEGDSASANFEVEDGVQDVTLIGNTAYGNDNGQGFSVHEHAYWYPVKHVRLIGNVTINTRVGISISEGIAGDGTNLEDVLIMRNQTINPTIHGIRVFGGKNITIRDNHVEKGIRLEERTDGTGWLRYPTDISIVGNVFVGPGKEHLVYVPKASFLKIERNRNLESPWSVETSD